jgi:zinc protease
MKNLFLGLLAVLFLLNPVWAQDKEASEEIKAVPEGVTADQVIQNYVTAIGGEKKMKKIKSLTTFAHTSIQGTDVMFTFHRMDPGKYYMEMGTVDMTFQKQICDGEKAKIIAMGNESEITGPQLEAVKYEGTLNKALKFKELGVTYELKGVVAINGKDAYYMTFVIPGGSVMNEYFDVESGLKVQTSSTVEAPEGDFESVIQYSNYKKVKGVLFPYTIKQSVAGQEVNLTVSSIIPNKVDPKVFEIK